MNLSTKILRNPFFLASMIPLGFFCAKILRNGLNIIENNLEKYNIEKFSITDSLRADTILRKQGETYRDTLVNYFKLLKREITFKTKRDEFEINGYLSVKNKEFSRYVIIKNKSPLSDRVVKNNETINYYLTQKIFGMDFVLDSLSILKYGTDLDFLDYSFKSQMINKKDTLSEVYTRETDLGKMILESEQEAVKNYLEKILEYKKSLKD